MKYHFQTTDTLTGEVRRFSKTGHREAYASLSVRIPAMRVECWNELGRLEPLAAFNPGDDDGDDGQSPCIVRESHWLCGWVEWVAIHESNEAALREADAMAAKLEGYPVLDEEHWSQLETKEAERVWRDCYRERDRIKYIRENRSQFKFHSFADMLGCCRGKYFAGYASELIS